MDARDIIYRRLTNLPRYNFRDLSILGIANEAVEALEAAGIDLVHRDENHGPTRDRAAEICERPVIGFQDGAVEASRYYAAAIRAMEVKHHLVE